MINCSGCPPCDPFFIVEKWSHQNKTISSLSVSRVDIYRDDFTSHQKFEQQKVPVNIFHSLFKSIETTNL